MDAFLATATEIPFCQQMRFPIRGLSAPDILGMRIPVSHGHICLGYIRSHTPYVFVAGPNKHDRFRPS